MKLAFELFAAAILTVAMSACASRPPLQTVPKVDLERYTGTWHEIAKYPNWFQRNCASGTTAEYSLDRDGSVGVVNRCHTADGRTLESRGVAGVVPGSGGAKLRVSFGGPFRGAYWIIGLDEKNYQWAVVGHPSRQFLWLLARDPEIPDSLYRSMVDLAVAQGYRESRIRRNP